MSTALDSECLSPSKPVPSTSTASDSQPTRATPMRVLLLYPQVPQTFWGLTHALAFLEKKVFSPPLGLLTVAAMLPKGTERRLFDLNVSEATDADIQWADYVFVSAMNVQAESTRALISRCKKLGARVVAGGPLFTMYPGDFPEVDHLLLDEAEVTFPEFLKDLEAGRPKARYNAEDFADMHSSPLPAYDLLDLKPYGLLSVQFSRGCPHQCDFCNVTTLFGHRPRTKTAAQIVAELDLIYSLGWKGKIFFVDDNLLCNKKYLKEELLPAMIHWQQGKSGISFHTQLSMNLADDQELMDNMYAAGFDWVFIGIETPVDASLGECSKKQNLNRNMPDQIARIQQSGFQILGGFIVGFDNDPTDIFRRQFDLIQNGGIPMAMVGILQAPPGTKLYDRLEKEHRLKVKTLPTDSVVCDVNFEPRMGRETLLNGYKSLVKMLYTPEHYYARVKVLLSRLKPPREKVPFTWEYTKAAIRCFFWLGVVREGRYQFWKSFVWTLLRRRNNIQAFLLLTIFGYHFSKVYNDMIAASPSMGPVTREAVGSQGEPGYTPA